MVGDEKKREGYGGNEPAKVRWKTKRGVFGANVDPPPFGPDGIVILK